MKPNLFMYPAWQAKPVWQVYLPMLPAFRRGLGTDCLCSPVSDSGWVESASHASSIGSSIVAITSINFNGEILRYLQVANTPETDVHFRFKKTTLTTVTDGWSITWLPPLLNGALYSVAKNIRAKVAL